MKMKNVGKSFGVRGLDCIIKDTEGIMKKIADKTNTHERTPVLVPG